jgi:hypothetical protein
MSSGEQRSPSPFPASDSELRSAPRSAWILFLSALACHLAAAAVGWNHRVIQDDVSAFRQAQTALNVYWMLGHNYKLAYETPLFGPPWSVPYEVPVYQWVVAELVTLTGWPIDQTGRAVSEAFFLLCLVPCWFLLRWVGVAPGARLLALSLLLLSPFYLFWSRTFLIESTALFFALAYLAAAWSFLGRPRFMMFLLALVLGVVAALVKITTCAAAWLALAFLLPGVVRTERSWLRAGGWMLLVAVPLVAGVLWTRFADGIKEQNLFARHLTSNALRQWNFGTWDQRWELHTWAVVLGRSPGMVLASAWLAASLILALIARRRRALVAACVLIHLTLPLVFTNLYYIHEYYACASMFFQVAAVSFAVIGLIERGKWRTTLGYGAAAAFVVVAAIVYVTEYYPVAAFDHVESAAVCRAVQEQTRPEDVILVLGADWASEVPYYSRRRALMIPSWTFTPPDELPRYLELVRGYRLGGIVVRQGYVSSSDIAGVLHDVRAAGLVPERDHADEVYSLYVLRPADVP